MVRKFASKRWKSAGQKTGDSQMRALSFLFAFAFVLAGQTLAGSPDGGLPGIGTFVYNSSPIVNSAPSILVAVR
jgi:hypothetical protein